AGGPYPNSTTTRSAGSGSSGVAKSEPISGLSPSTKYYFRVVAGNSAGTTNGDQASFTTATPIPPGVPMSAATNVANSSPTLNGGVSPNGSDTTYHFDYGTSPGGPYTGHTADQSAGSGSSSVAKSEDVSGLAANQDYYFVLVAGNVA